MSTEAVVLARKSLGLEDEPSKTVPVSYLRAVEGHLRRFPGDDHFIIELAEESGMGGNGFGTVTCMEDFCWVDINLDSDPAKPDGGKAEGFGSLFNFQMHCTEDKHVKAREARLKNARRPIPPRVTPQQLHALSPAQPMAHRPSPVPALTSSFGPFGQAQGPPPAVDRTASHPPGHVHGIPTRQPPLASASASASSSSSSSFASSPFSQLPRNLPSSSQSSSFSDTSYDHLSRPDLHRYGLSSSPSSSSSSNPNCLSGFSSYCDCPQCALALYRSHSQRTSRHSSSHRSKKGRAMSGPAPTSAAPTWRTSQSSPSRDSDKQEYDQLSLSMPHRASVDSKPVASALPVATARAPLANLPPNVPPSFHPLWTNVQRSLLRKEGKMLNDFLKSPQAKIATKDEKTMLITRVNQLNDMIRLGPPYIPTTEELLKYQPLLRAVALSWQYLAPVPPPPPPPQPFSADIVDRINAMSASALAGPSSSNALSTLSRDGPAYLEAQRNMFGLDFPGGRYGYGYGYGSRGRLAMSKDDLEQFFTSALNDFDSDSTVEDALKALNMPTMNSKFADLTITLMPHQIIGVAFMLEKEKSPKFKGGLLCDAMGLGKTVQTIGAIVGNKSEDRKVKTTLVIAPLALLQQWKAEIINKTTADTLSVLIHHGPQRSKRVKDLQKYDVILTTYGTLVSEHGKEPKPKPKKQDDDDDSFDEEEEVRVQGPLFKMQFWRVVLDEAHFIRNRQTRNARAVWDLDAVHRWSVTGTLIVNGLLDVFPHLHFLGVSPSKEYSHFNEYIGKLQKSNPQTATTRTQAILKTCMLRRHKDSTLNGVRLLNLPERTVDVVELNFTEEERSIYDGIEQRMQIRFNSFLRKGTVMKHYACILVMLLRLRQLTCHPYLLRRDPADAMRHPGDFVISDDELLNSGNTGSTSPVDDATELERAERVCGSAFVQKAKALVSERDARLAAQQPSKGPKAPKLERGTTQEADVEEHECPICFDNLTDPVITPCLHIFCRTCVGEVCSTETIDTSLSEADIARGARPCPLCRGPIEKTKLFKISAFSEQDELAFDDKSDVKEEKSEIKREKKPDVSGSGKRDSPIEISSDDDEPVDKKPKLCEDRKGKAKAEPDSIILDAQAVPDAAPTSLNDVDGIVPSTKMKHMGELLETFLQEDDVKIVVFSQFVSFLDLLAAYLREKQVGYCIYEGSMNTRERDETIRQFNSVEDWAPRVILISLKCGGVGLNLTVASKAICLDMAWNAATEMQAWDRLHRIGQTKPVLIKRVVIAGTVEQRIMNLQKEKSALADGAMGEGAVGKLGRLSVGDLCRLFGVSAG